MSENSDQEITKKMKEICKLSSQLDRNAALDVGRLVVQSGFSDYIKFNSDNGSIDLDHLRENSAKYNFDLFINNIFSQIMYKLKK